MAHNYASVFWGDADVISGNLLIPGLAFNAFNGTWFSNPPATGDILEFTVRLDPGAYNCLVSGITGSASGIQDIFIDGVFAFSIDHYSPLAVFNVDVFNPVTIVNEQPVIRSVCNGNNPSSGDFFLQINRMAFFPL